MNRTGSVAEIDHVVDLPRTLPASHDEEGDALFVTDGRSRCNEVGPPLDRREFIAVGTMVVQLAGQFSTYFDTGSMSATFGGAIETVPSSGM